MGIALDAEEQRALLGTHGEAVLATTGAGGDPVPLPVWYVVLDDAVFVRTPAAARRLRHIARRDTVALLVHDGEAWRELRGLMTTARAEVVDDPALAQRVRAALDERFSDLLPPPLPEHVAARYDDSVILRITPLRDPVSWDNRKIRLPST